MKCILISIMLYGWVIYFIPVSVNAVDRDLIQWERLDSDRWFDFDEWKTTAIVKSKTKNYVENMRVMHHQEKVGRFLSCINRCLIYRGEGYVNASFRSSFQEGDEIKLGPDSYAWLFLMDGTLLRLSPNTSISFNEINITKKEFYFGVKLNYGNLIWLGRGHSKMMESKLPETDVVFYPVRWVGANPKLQTPKYRDQNYHHDLNDEMKVLEQYLRLNSVIDKNNKSIVKKDSYSFIVLPNGTLLGKNSNFHIFYQFGAQAYVKEFSYYKNHQENFKSTYHYRGMTFKPHRVIERDQWYKISSNGDEIDKFNDQSAIDLFEKGHFLIKRIPTILLTREFMLERYSKDLFQEYGDLREFFRTQGYAVWESLDGSEVGIKNHYLAKRVKYLFKYVRFMETQNLHNIDKLRVRLKKRGEEFAKEMNFTEIYQLYFQHSAREYARSITYTSDYSKDERMKKYGVWRLKFAAGNP